MNDPYKDIDFDSVEHIDDLSNIFRQPPYDPANDPRTKNENPVGILEQFRTAERNNYENAAMVLYVDRTKFASEKLVELKSMWFDEDGNRVPRPVRSTDNE